MHERMLPVAQKTGVLLGVCLLPGLVGAPHPWWALTVIAVGLLQYAVMQLRVPRMARPELGVFASFLVLQAFCTTGVLLAGRVPDGGMFILIWPIIGFATRLPTRAVVPCTAWSCALLVAAYLTTDLHGTLADPAPVTVGLALFISAAALVTTLRNSDAANHSAAILDPLTGLRNRTALERRVEGLEAGHDGVTVVVLDIDHFKRVNDARGHDAGDAVLRGLADSLAEQLRPDDELYRLGGEEFVAILPHATAEEGRAVADRLLATVRRRPVAGSVLTISAGVAAVAPDAEFSWRRVYRRADAALYAAKEGGRDQIRIAGLTGLPAAADAVA